MSDEVRMQFDYITKTDGVSRWCASAGPPTATSPTPHNGATSTASRPGR